ncbi:DUF4129 domain-containing protein [Cellulosimicrobium marinum]|uniref:DUF4129 domain-containing protein n=1 Tax=Cellulosimicrobium marinum TaxID=1638992 RepID=UPI001E5D701E|nr:DUF4129 domain-containing protein [Cellulosimicrobium marinum]MCB7137506.1 DUF4129 domain-containing protein [Cellulosimicrobium marinum]
MTTPQGAPQQAPRTTHPGPRRFLTTTALATLTLLAAATAPPLTWTPTAWLRRLAQDPSNPYEPPPVTPAPTPTEPPPDLTDQSGFGLGDYLLALAAVALLVLLLALARHLATRIRRGRPTHDPAHATPGDTLTTTDDDTLLPRLRDAVHHAHHTLDPALPPRDAVVAAWVALEDAAALAGTQRDHAQTPTEFTVAVLDRTPADPAAVRALRDLYHRARFRDGDVGAHDVHRAREALARLATTLDVTADARPDVLPDGATSDGEVPAP